MSGFVDSDKLNAVQSQSILGNSLKREAGALHLHLHYDFGKEVRLHYWGSKYIVLLYEFLTTAQGRFDCF
jgi:hypothetical protein